MKSVLIICLKYAPGNWQHMKSFAYCLKERGYNVHFIISQNFQWMNIDFSDMADYLASSKSFLTILLDVFLFFLWRWYSFIKIFRKYKPRVILFVMWHPLNYFLAKILKTLYPNTQTCYWMHEPYKVDKSEYKEKLIAFNAIEYLQQMLLPFIDIVILHSNRALNAFNIRYSNYKGKIKLIPLLFKDECKIKDVSSRMFDITFIGNAARAKGIDDFFEIVKKNRELNLGLRLQLVTPSKIDRYLSELDCWPDSLLKVINKPRISDDEIREACAKSLTIIAPYRETTQSGVVPVAFMCGTPVIATDIEGLREYVIDKVNGMLISKDFSLENVISVLKYVKENFSELSQNARKSYEETWAEWNFDKYYEWLIELLKVGDLI